MNHKTQKFKTRITGICLIIFLIFNAIALLQETQAQSNNAASANWNLSMTLQANNGTKINIKQNPTFAPFDLIQLSANLTKGNLTAPNTPVVFKVKGPTSSSYPTEIVRSSITDNTSLTSITFRIPLETSERTVQGTWQIFANANTSIGTTLQNATFQVAWPIQVSSINFLDSKNQNQTTFALGTTAKAILTLSCNQEQAENIYINIQDVNKKIINQTQMQNILFNATNANQIAYEFTIPKDTKLGAATLNLAIFSGSYEGVDISSAQNTTAYFTISNNTTSILSPFPSQTPTPSLENSISLFSWILVTTGIFTFTALFIFLKRKPVPKINNQITTTKEPSLNQNIVTSLAQPEEKQALLLAQIPSIYETLNIPILESSSPQDQKQIIINQLTKISSASQKVQDLESELKNEKDLLNKEISILTNVLENQEKAAKNYFDAIRQEMANLNPTLNINKNENATSENKPNQEFNKKVEGN